MPTMRPCDPGREGPRRPPPGRGRVDPPRPGRSLQVVVRCLPRDLNVVRMTLAEAAAGDADELGIGA